MSGRVRFGGETARMAAAKTGPSDRRARVAARAAALSAVLLAAAAASGAQDGGQDGAQNGASGGPAASIVFDSQISGRPEGPAPVPARRGVPSAETEVVVEPEISAPAAAPPPPPPRRPASLAERDALEIEALTSAAPTPEAGATLATPAPQTDATVAPPPPEQSAAVEAPADPPVLSAQPPTAANTEANDDVPPAPNPNLSSDAFAGEVSDAEDLGDPAAAVSAPVGAVGQASDDLGGDGLEAFAIDTPGLRPTALGPAAADAAADAAASEAETPVAAPPETALAPPPEPSSTDTTLAAAAPEPEAAPAPEAQAATPAPAPSSPAPSSPATSSPATSSGDPLADGRRFLSDGDAEAALAAFETALVADAEDLSAGLGRARALAALGRDEEAMDALDALAERAPRSRSVRLARGELKYRQGALEAAAADLRVASSGGAPSPLALQRLGDVFYALGDPERALVAYQRAAGLPGASGGLRRAMGNALFALGDYDAANTAYTEALISDPADGRAALHRAWTREALGRWASALEDYDLAVETLGGRDPRATLDRGRLLRAVGAAAEALEDFRTAAELSTPLDAAGADERSRLQAGPDAALAGRRAAEPEKRIEIHLAALLGAARALNDLGQPVDAAEQLVELEAVAAALGGDAPDDPSLSRSILFETGRAALLSRDATAAERAFSELIDLDPGRADARANRAIARLGLDDVAGSLDDWREATRLAPREPRFHYGLARTAVAAGDAELAAQASADAENLARQDPSARLERARTLLALGRPLAALGVLDAALAWDPRSLEGGRLKAKALGRLGRDREALSAALALLERAPRNPSARLLEAESRIALGDPSGARLALNTANGLGGDPARVASLAGDAWLTEARLGGAEAREPAVDQAIRAYNLAVRLSRGAPSALARRAAAFERAGRLDDARGDLDRAVGARPQDPELRFARAGVLKALDECALAIPDYDAGLSLRPENALARAARASCKFDQGAVFGALVDYIGSFF